MSVQFVTATVLKESATCPVQEGKYVGGVWTTTAVPTLAEAAIFFGSLMLPYEQGAIVGTLPHHGLCARNHCRQEARWMIDKRRTSKRGKHSLYLALCDEHADEWWNLHVQDWPALYPFVCRACGHAFRTERSYLNHGRFKRNRPPVSRARLTRRHLEGVA